MDFKRTINNKTKKVTYFLDNKKVSSNIFENKELICKLKGMNCNSSLTTSNNKYTHHYFSYN